MAERLGADEGEEAAGRLHAPERRSRSRGSGCSCCSRARLAPNLAHAYVDAWSSKKSAKWLENNYGYGHANIAGAPDLERAAPARSSSRTRMRSALPNAYLDRNIPQRVHVREAVGRGEGGLTVEGTRREAAAPALRRRRRLDRATPALLSPPLGWLLRLLPRSGCRSSRLYSFSVLVAATPVPHGFDARRLARLFHLGIYLPLFWKSVQMSLIVSALVVAASRIRSRTTSPSRARRASTSSCWS